MNAVFCPTGWVDLSGVLCAIDVVTAGGTVSLPGVLCTSDVVTARGTVYY